MTQLMPVYDRFEPVLAVPGPTAYLLPYDPRVVALLKLHGLAVEPFTANGFNRAAMFTVDSVVSSARAFQGHKETRITGHWGTPVMTSGLQLGQQSYVVVSAEGRFGPLAAYLLEPESDDGLVGWNFFDPSLSPNSPFPVMRLYK